MRRRAANCARRAPSPSIFDQTILLKPRQRPVPRSRLKPLAGEPLDIGDQPVAVLRPGRQAGQDQRCGARVASEAVTVIVHRPNLLRAARYNVER
jgi:hypothetical protein